MTSNIRVEFPKRRESLNKQTIIRFTHEEHARYTVMAEEMGLSLNTVVRSLLEAQYTAQQSQKESQDV